MRVLGGVDAAGMGVSIGIENGMQGSPDASSPVLDATGLTVAPGFIDVQVNGAFGDDFTADPHSIWRVGERLVSTGVTSFCPTIITAPPGAMEAAQEAMASRPPDYTGAEPIGLHLEGPFLSEAKRGTHPAHLLRPPRLDIPLENVRIVTLAPELDGAIDLVRHLSAEGVVVALGHSAASTATARLAIDAGATMGTHLLNAMLPISARDPGLAGVLLADGRTHFSVIADGIHHDPSTLQILWRAAPDRFVLITDAIAAAGMPDGEYALGDVPVVKSGVVVRNAAGDLAGSAALLDHNLSVLMDATGAPLADAMNAVTLNPAEALGRWDLGRLRRGTRGDLVLLDGHRVVATVVAGVVVHLDEPDRWKDGPIGTP